MLYRY